MPSIFFLPIGNGLYYKRSWRLHLSREKNQSCLMILLICIPTYATVSDQTLPCYKCKCGNYRDYRDRNGRRAEKQLSHPVLARPLPILNQGRQTRYVLSITCHKHMTRASGFHSRSGLFFSSIPAVPLFMSSALDFLADSIALVRRGCSTRT